MTNLVEKVTVEEKEQEVVISVSQIYAPITVDWKIIVKAEYHIQADGLITMSYHECQRCAASGGFSADRYAVCAG